MQRVISSGNFTMGKEVRRFEEQFASFFGSKYAVMSNSGSSANLLALAAIRYSEGWGESARNEIIVPAVSWSTTYYPVAQLGYTLRFVDIDIDSLNLDISKVREAINESTAGIFAVNLLGNPADLVALRLMADTEGIFLLEDNCESMASSVSGRFAGTYGEIGTFSTFFSHHISTMEGGVCLTDSLELAQIMTSMRAHGWTRELPVENHVHNKSGNQFDDLFRFVLPGYNLRPLELSGAIGQEQLSKLPDLIDVRRQNASHFVSLFEDDQNVKIQRPSGESSWFGFSLVLEGKLHGRRQELVDSLTAEGIDSRPIVAGNFTRNPVMKHLNHSPLPALPVADIVHDQGLFVGNHHYDLVEQITKLRTVVSSLEND